MGEKIESETQSLIFESGIVLVKDHKTVFLPNMMKWLEAGVLGLGYRADYRGGYSHQ